MESIHFYSLHSIFEIELIFNLVRLTNVKLQADGVKQHNEVDSFCLYHELLNLYLMSA